ncbi:hypothetical protein BJF78_11640 [Pseudonocardia sp. CNS-139]|nr:hypothetical protein BJF78_11640 [Pseudonocardia sp. CNS-139]
MRAGDTVLVGTSGASRDLADGADVRFDRGPSLNTAFGLGAHRCLGIHLARHQLEIALELVTALAPPFRLAPGAAPRMRTLGNVWGYDTLPLVFERGA